MTWLLLLGHALVGALVLPTAAAGPGVRRRAVEVASVAGALLGIGLVVAGVVEAAGWRSVAFAPETAVPAGFAIAAAWVLTGALATERARAEDVALMGVAASGLALAATGRHVVPALLFWLCASAALARSRSLWPVLAVSDACVCAAAVVYVVDTGEWAIGTSGPGAVSWLLAAGAVVRAAAPLAAPSAGAVAPLLAGSAVVLAARGGRAEPWLALAVLVAAGALLARALGRGRVPPRLLELWPAALAVAVCFVAPGRAAAAGAAAVLAVTAATLWPYAGSFAGFERALLVAGVPLTAGFAMVAAGASASFERANDASSLASSAPWALVAAALPAALAGGVVLGGRASRVHGPRALPEAVLATWVLVAVSALVALFPAVVGDRGDGGQAALYAAALVAGAAAAVALPLEPRRVVPAALEPDAALTFPRAPALALGAASAAIAGVAVWLTVWGLRVGFL